jgi:DNA integrity scanning protein DisA with diadenylate cyclase activity
MKKLFIIFILLMAVSAAYNQSLQKGNLVGMHVITLKLNPNFTNEQAMDFFMKKYIPAAEESFPGMKVYLVKGIRGENENRIGQIAVFESEAVRDKYYKKDGSYTDAGNEALKKIQPVLDEFTPMGTFTTVYTDWVIQ